MLADGGGIQRSSSEEPLVNVSMTRKDVAILQELISERAELQKETSIESLIELAKEYKALAKVRFPESVCEVYVDEDTRRVEVKFPEDDRFFNNIKVAELIILRHKKRSESPETVNRRIYV